MLGGCLPHRTGTQSKGRARCDEERARPVVRWAGCETNGERDLSPASGATVRGAQGRCICQMASLWSATWPSMKALPNPIGTSAPEPDPAHHYIRDPTAPPPPPPHPNWWATVCVVQIAFGIPRRTDPSKNGHLADVAALPAR